MPIFKCENPALKQVLIDLHALIVDCGGYVSDDVSFVEEQGELRMISSLPNTNHDNLIVLPDSCLPRIEDFVITAYDNKLIAEPKASNVSETHIATMGLMINIYNITNKLSKHRATNPWLALKNSPAITQKLYEARADEPKVKQYYEMFKSNNFDELLLDSFIGSRMFDLRSNDEEKPSYCLLPLIDFANHCLESPTYQRSDDKNCTLSLKNSVPIAGSKECFVCYSILDALDSFLVFGFVDANAPFVRSLPLQFDLHEYSRIQVRSRATRLFTGKLPDYVHDLRLYLPYVIEVDDSVMQLSHLIIPGKNAPLALRRILTYLIRDWKPGLAPTVVNNIVINAEKLIIDKNVEYYTSLSSSIEVCNDVSTDITQSLKSLVDMQLNRLYQYQERIKNLG
jgi:hypothetical protein